jgi:hypothetical protein
MSMLLLLAVAAVPFLIWVVVVMVREPLRLTLPVYAALIPFGGILAVGNSKFLSLSSLVGALLGAGLILHLFRVRHRGFPVSATVPVWLLFVGVAGATVLWSRAPQTTANSVFVLCSLVAIYVLVALCPVDRDILRRVENGLLLGGLACVGYGVFQLVAFGGFPADPPVPGVTDGRFGNDLLGPNNQAVALILPLVISLSRSVRAADRSRRVQYTAAAALLLGGVLMTGSRGGLLATGVALLVLVAVTTRDQGKARLGAYAVIGAVLAAFIFLTHPFGLAERTVEVDSSSGRTDIWRVGLAACPQYCAFGSGWGTFRDVYSDTQASVADARVLVGAGAYEPHNVWVLVGIELGSLGIVLLAAGLFLSLAEAWRLPTSLRGPPLSAMAATVVAATFLSNLEFKFFWMALMIIALSRNVTDADEDDVDAEPPRDETVARGQSWV